LPGTELVDTDLDDDAISYRHVDALMDPQTPIIQVLEEWLLNYQATGGEGDEDEEEAREEEKRYLAELVGFVWRVSPKACLSDPCGGGRSAGKGGSFGVVLGSGKRRDNMTWM
jgi:hypothetical protein